MKNALIGLGGAGAFVAALAASPAPAHAQCSWTGYQWVCHPAPSAFPPPGYPMPSYPAPGNGDVVFGPFGNEPRYHPENAYAASRNWGNMATGMQPPWNASYPGPRAAGDNAGD